METRLHFKAATCRRTPNQLAADGFIDEAEALHFGGVEKVAAVEHDRMGHGFAGAFEIKFFEFGPFGGDDDCVTAFGSRIHFRNVSDVIAGREKRFGFIHRLRIVNAQARAVLKQTLAEIDGGRHSNVVGVLFEGEAEDSDIFVFKDPKRIEDFFDETLHLIGVNFLNFLEQVEFVAQLLGNFDKSAEIFWEAASAETERGVEKAAANALVHAYAIGDFLDVGAGGFANDRDGVDVGNL